MAENNWQVWFKNAPTIIVILAMMYTIFIGFNQVSINKSENVTTSRRLQNKIEILNELMEEVDLLIIEQKVSDATHPLLLKISALEVENKWLLYENERLRNGIQ